MWRPLTLFDPSRLGRRLAPGLRNLAYTSLWTIVFIGMSAGEAVGDKHPGQYLPFWTEACEAGSARACAYEEYLTLAYCMNGSGWACNETGILLARIGRIEGQMFERGCTLGFPPACTNADRTGTESVPPARAGPLLSDLPIVLRGTKPPLRERAPAKLYALACEQGWPGACEGRSGEDQP